jgi:hypothetical protein
MRNLHDIERKPMEEKPNGTDYSGVLALAIICGTVIAVAWIIWG